MRVVKKAVIGGVVAVALAVLLYFALVWASVKSTSMIPVTVVSEVLE